MQQSRDVLGLTLETGRLLLRPPMKSDLEPWAALLADPVASQFLGGPQDLSGAWRNLALMTGAWIIGGFSNFSVLEKSTGRWIGRAGPWQPEGWPDPEIGWAFDRSAWGSGYATEAVSKCMDWAFEQLGWTEVVHLIPANSASIALAKNSVQKDSGIRSCWRQLKVRLMSTVRAVRNGRRDMKAGHSCEPKVCGIEGPLFAFSAQSAQLPLGPVPLPLSYDKQNPLEQLILTPRFISVSTYPRTSSTRDGAVIVGQHVGLMDWFGAQG